MTTPSKLYRRRPVVWEDLIPVQFNSTVSRSGIGYVKKSALGDYLGYDYSMNYIGLRSSIAEAKQAVEQAADRLVESLMEEVQ
jgi:hypothetical protein